MTVSNLMLSLLAMDAYNQGYSSGINGAATQIGGANFRLDSSQLKDANGDRLDIPAGFYAVAYRLDDGTTVISYRGTDFITAKNGVGGDALNGYGLGAGSPLGTQAVWPSNSIMRQ